MPYELTSQEDVKFQPTTMKDSGARQQFSTGAVRDANTDKPMPHLISPFALMRLGAWLGLGAQKYAERNWEQGMPISRCVASLFRHTLAYMMGKRDEDHAAAIMCNIMFIIHYEEMIKLGVLSVELDDMPKYEPVHPTKCSTYKLLKASTVAEIKEMSIESRKDLARFILVPRSE